MIGWRSRLLAIAAALLACVAGTTSDSEDFVFETDEVADAEDSVRPSGKPRGVSDVQAQFGKLLEFTIPDVEIQETSTLPDWLLFDRRTSTFSGIPLATDKSRSVVSLTARDGTKHVFRIRVRKQSYRDPTCPKTSYVLTVYLERKLEDLGPRQRAATIRNLAGFLGLNASAFSLGTEKLFNDATSDGSVVFAGPGDVGRRTSTRPTTVQLSVGCSGKLSDKYLSLIERLKEEALDGTLAEVVGSPVLGWRVRRQKSTTVLERGRRDVYDKDYEDYPVDYEYEYDEDEDLDEKVTTIQPIIEDRNALTTTVTTITVPANTITAEIVTSERSTIVPESTQNHPHRHHHGEMPKMPEGLQPEGSYTNEDDVDLPVTVMTPPTVATPTTKPTTTTRQTVTTKQTTTTTLPDDPYYDEEDITDDVDNEITEMPITIVEPTATQPTQKTTHSRTTVQDRLPYETTIEDASPTEKLTTVFASSVREETIYDDLTSPEESTTVPTIAISISTAVVPSTTTTTSPEPTTITTTETTTTETTAAVTTQTTTTTTEKSTTTFTRTSESVQYGFKNFRPQINHRLKKIHITAGTVLSFIIPEDTFQDIEDGSDLQLKFVDQSPVKNNWIQFNERTKEIYGLPLEEHVSKYNFLVWATDKNGANVSDNLEVIVQQHKGSRTVTHEFQLHLRVEKKNEFLSAVDWQLKTLRGLAALFHDKDLSNIVVRNIKYDGDDVTFSWTNDTLPKSYCPKRQLDQLLNVMKANDKGDPSYQLGEALSPELRVLNVRYTGIGQCEEKPEKPATENFSPIPRNQVDHINATAGELLVFRVPDDTFYDPEDGNARNLKMTLLTMDRRPLPKDYWLQFDAKNQEFYGVPLASDVGRSEFQLVCEDRGGLTANDAIVVAVNPPVRVRYNVEFRMTLDVDHSTFSRSAADKRKFVEKLGELFRDKNKNNIHISSISEGSTLVSWNNKSLPTDRCPNSEIKRLRKVLINDDETLADRIELIMSPDFPVSSISLIPIGICQGEQTVVHTPGSEIPIDESQPAESADDYLVTFVVPIVIIAFMLILAGIVACVLYRRRRTGKMNVVEDERQSFRNKGIPVIFQDEIDEKPDPATKAPVILKEEKPPLAPPEYSKGGTPVQHDENEDAPYQPPPPFTPSGQDNSRTSRPKPTPTYRKPPPYVPP